MQFKSVKILLAPLIKKGHDWQHTSINGDVKKPFLWFSDAQIFLILISAGILFKLDKGISEEIIGYVMAAFSISVSLFMSLLVSIFDKFENTKFETESKTAEEITRLIQKKNFFKRFISITSYLVLLSILVIVLCSLTYMFNLPVRSITPSNFTLDWAKVDLILTLKSSFIIVFRVTLNYFLLNYLFLTLFITGSAYEYYMSEMDRNRIINPSSRAIGDDLISKNNPAAEQAEP
jgi:hypothetical protein